MESVAEFGSKPFFQELLEMFQVHPDLLHPATGNPMTKEELLNLFAPPVPCDFAVTEPSDGPEFFIKRLHPEWKIEDGVGGLLTKRGRPKKPRKTKSLLRLANASRKSSPVSSVGDRRVRELVWQYGQLQKENLEMANKIMTLRKELRNESGGLVSESDLDQLVGVGRTCNDTGVLKNALLELLVTKQSNYSLSCANAEANALEEFFIKF